MDDLLLLMNDGGNPSAKAKNSSPSESGKTNENEMDDLLALMDDGEDDDEDNDNDNDNDIGEHSDSSSRSSNIGSKGDGEDGMLPDVEFLASTQGDRKAERGRPQHSSIPRTQRASSASASTASACDLPRSPTSITSNISSTDKAASRRTQRKEYTTNKPVNASIDDRLGIRMINRSISSVDLMDFISGGLFQSPAALSAMSLQNWIRLLVEPPPTINRDSIAGKTNACTVGIVFSNSGTRLSAKGNAFCIMTIGSFASGPCITVFLFGDCYSKFCKSCTAGKVIAINCPKLLPPRESRDGKGPSNGDTSVSFSVTDPRQLKLVATARDFGFCKATVRVKQPNGNWAPTGSCKNYVDKRRCEYCDKHKKQMITNGGGGMAGGKASANMSYVQQMRTNTAGMFRNTLTSARQQTNRDESNNTSGINGTVTRSSAASIIADRFNAQQTESNRFLEPASTISASRDTMKDGLASRVPMHMKRDQSGGRGASRSNRMAAPAMGGGNAQLLARQAKQSQNPLFGRRLQSNKQSAGGAQATRNPYATQKPKKKLGFVGNNSDDHGAANGASLSSTSQRRGARVSNWLQVGGKRKGVSGSFSSSSQQSQQSQTSKSANVTKKPRRSIATTAKDGFDGSVFVPKPSALFANSAPRLGARNNAATDAAILKYGEDTQTQQTIRQRQAEMAARLRLQQEGQPQQQATTKSRPSAKIKLLHNGKVVQVSSPNRSSGVATRKAGRSASNAGASTNSFARQFGTMGSQDEARVRSAKSMFANEAAAEEFARSRGKLVELEEMESKEQAREKRKESKTKAAGIDRHWVCLTCGGQRRAARPASCINANHNVRVKRSIVKKASKEEERSRLHGGGASDGGLRLGAGLEWSMIKSRRFA